MLKHLQRAARVISVKGVSLLFLVAAHAAEPQPQSAAGAARKIDFVRDVRPILSSRCYECHGEKKQKGELRWDMKAVALKGGASGPALVPGKSSESLVIQLVSGLKGNDSRMPAKG